MALTTERGRVAHLLRRAGFGAGAAELDAATSAGVQATLERLLAPDQQADDVDTKVPRDAFDFTKAQDAIRWWVLRMVHTKRQFQEKMTLFWHGHLTSGLSRTGGRPELMVQQIDTYRRLGLGNFRDLVLASAKDPAMILWLDNNQNRKGKPNENYARELMELFTLGIGNYSENDIREAARAFTGWFQRDGQFFFTANQHDTGSKTVLGYTGNWDGGDIIDFVVRHPAGAPFIATKLWSFFVYPKPEPAIISQVADVFTSSGYDITATMRAIFTHPAFYSDRAYHAVTKSPLEFSIGLLRSLGAATDGAMALGPLQAMGQTPMNPPNVAGWPGGENWISTTSMIARYNFVTQVLRTGADNPTNVDMTGLLNSRNLTTKDQILDFFIDLMVDGDMSAEKRGTLDTYLLAKDDGTPGSFT
ncbi:MAG: DUF1800 domain-containing protein, partial [Chloroflexi bacterium]|nr:DUF1800 domain-containing protein [Chloroflexota bacterium]